MKHLHIRHNTKNVDDFGPRGKHLDSALQAQASLLLEGGRSQALLFVFIHFLLSLLAVQSCTLLSPICEAKKLLWHTSID